MFQIMTLFSGREMGIAFTGHLVLKISFQNQGWVKVRWF